MRHRLRHPGDPGFAADLPSGALRDDLAAVLSIRRLLPLVTSSVRVRTIAVLDDEEKTTVRLRIESGTSSPPEGGGLHELEPRVTDRPGARLRQGADAGGRLLEGGVRASPGPRR